MSSTATRVVAGRRNRRGEATRELVLDAAEACIFELGFNRASAGEVTRRAGVTFGVVQYHFGTYEALLLAVVERAGDRLRALLREVDLSTGSTADKIRAVADTVWSHFSRPQYLAYLEINLNLLRDPTTTDKTRQSIRRFDAAIEKLWHDTVGAVLGTGEDEIALQRLLFGTMRGMALSRWLNEGRLDFERERALFVSLLTEHADRGRLNVATQP